MVLAILDDENGKFGWRIRWLTPDDVQRMLAARTFRAAVAGRKRHVRWMDPYEAAEFWKRLEQGLCSHEELNLRPTDTHYTALPALWKGRDGEELLVFE